MGGVSRGEGGEGELRVRARDGADEGGETAKSALHALDVRARASVSRVVADAADARRAAVAAAANEARRALLRDARALDGSRDDVFEEMAMLEGAFAQTLSDL